MKHEKANHQTVWIDGIERPLGESGELTAFVLLYGGKLFLFILAFKICDWIARLIEPFISPLLGL